KPDTPGGGVVGLAALTACHSPPMSSKTNAESMVGPSVAAGVATQPGERHAARTAHRPVAGVPVLSGFPSVAEGPKSARYRPVKALGFAGPAVGELPCSPLLVNTTTRTMAIVAISATPATN